MILMQRAIPRISVSFDVNACNQQKSPITSCVIFCSAEERQHSHFVVKSLIEDWLRNVREPYATGRPNLNLKFRSVKPIDRDQILHNGYSVLHQHPGIGPVLHWGFPGGVSLIDLMGMATVIKTFNHYYDMELKSDIAQKLQIIHPVDEPAILNYCRQMVHTLFEGVTNMARMQRLCAGKESLVVHDPFAFENDYIKMQWQHAIGRYFGILVVFENFDLKYVVPPHLFDLFDSCFGPELTYRMVPEGI